ncbi:MAG TPA: proline racemase family protein [Bryobacteraceae bacterium]|jgi:4-hydroxyproline epimerase|nr:proline racemase family protein [Bryobacteraceae bacterium]
MTLRKIHTIDSHTGGEPTRVVVDGGPPLRRGPLADQLQQFRNEFDHWRSAIVNEPRGSDAIVGALLCEPQAPDCSAGVIFFNNVGYLGMCGHGTIGLAVTLQHLGRIKPGPHRIETPVGIVEAVLHANNEVTVRNVPSYRSQTGVSVEVEGFGTVIGDVAWGGNWFFLTYDLPFPLEFSNLDRLSDYAWKIRQALTNKSITGADGKEIDHIEVYGPPTNDQADSKNFVLCPGRSYDRSPCGTGTSAKLACLYADGKLREGKTWRQESIIGSIFHGSFTVRDGMILPEIRGSAFINAESRLILDDHDPFQWGIGAIASVETRAVGLT